MKKHAKHEVREEKTTEDISLNLSGMNWNWTKRVNMDYVIAAFFIIFCVAFVFSVRTSPEKLKVTDSWATSTLQQNVRSQVAQQVDQQFPALPDTNRNALIDKRTAELIASQQDQFDQVQQQLSQNFKTNLQYTGDDGKEYTYLGDLDSYFWLRYTRNILNHGNVCDAVVNGQCRDMYQNAPVGLKTSYNPSFHIFAIYGLYKFITIFHPGYPLPATSFLLQAIIGSLVVIPAFFIGRRLSGNVGGFFAAVIIALNALYLSRSLGSDNDVWNVFIPLIIIWMVIEALEAKRMWTRVLFALLAGAAVAFHAATWGGWWFVYLIVLIGLIAYTLFRILTEVVRNKNRQPWKSPKVIAAAIILAVFYFGTFLFLIIPGEHKTYFTVPTLAFSASSELGNAVGQNYWPNVLTTVAELNKSSFGDAVNTMGGKLFFFIALLGLLLLILPRDRLWNWKHYSLFGIGALISLYLISNPELGKFTVLALLALPIAAILLLYLFDEEHIDLAAGLIILMWFLASTYASYSGVRFILLMIPAFGIAFSVTAGRVYEWITGFLNREIKWHHYITNVIVFALIALVLFQPVRAGMSTADNYIPSIDDAWWNSLSKIRMESQPDAIINSWWDFGHWFKYVADRRVTADGTTQHTHTPRWLGLALVTPDERESVGILRMLDCGSDAFPHDEGKTGAYGRILAKENDPIKSERMLRDLVKLDKSDAQKYLAKSGYSAEETQSILNVTHCNAPEDYFITSGDMVGKAGVWAHFGLWDFQRAYIAQTARNMPQDEAIADLKARFGYTDEQAQSLYYEAKGLTSESDINAWVAPWPGYVGGWASCTPKNSTIECPIGAGISQQGSSITAIDGFIFDKKNPKNSSMIFGVYQGGQRLGGVENGTPSILIVAGKDGLSEIAFDNPSTSLGVLVDTEQNRVLVGDKNLLRSTFTQLYYLDGRYSKYFEKFDDTTSFSGERIIVWKVNWDGKKSTGQSANTTAITAK